MLWYKQIIVINLRAPSDQQKYKWFPYVLKLLTRIEVPICKHQHHCYIILTSIYYTIEIYWLTFLAQRNINTSKSSTFKQ